MERYGKSSISLEKAFSLGWVLGPFWGVESLGGVSTEDRGFSGVSWLLNSRLQTVSDMEPQGSSLMGECLGVFVLTFENSGASFLTGVFLSVFPNGVFLLCPFPLRPHEKGLEGRAWEVSQSSGWRSNLIFSDNSASSLSSGS